MGTAGRKFTRQPSSIFHPCCVLHSIATRWGYHPPSGHGHLLCALRIAGWPRDAASCSRCVREAFPAQACGRLHPSGAQEGQTQGEGYTFWTEARTSGAPLRLVHPPRVWRRRHGDLPGQGAGHLPCRVSRPVSRCHVAVGGAVSTAAAAPPRDLASVPRRPRIRGRVEGGCTRIVQLSGHPTVTAGHARSTAPSARGAPDVFCFLCIQDRNNNYRSRLGSNRLTQFDMCGVENRGLHDLHGFSYPKLLRQTGGGNCGAQH